MNKWISWWLKCSCIERTLLTLRIWLPQDKLDCSSASCTTEEAQWWHQPRVLRLLLTNMFVRPNRKKRLYHTVQYISNKTMSGKGQQTFVYNTLCSIQQSSHSCQNIRCTIITVTFQFFLLTNQQVAMIARMNFSLPVHFKRERSAKRCILLDECYAGHVVDQDGGWKVTGFPMAYQTSRAVAEKYTVIFDDQTGNCAEIHWNEHGLQFGQQSRRAYPTSAIRNTF